MVEDHEGLREITRETLESQGYTVVLATDGEQAVREFQSRRGQIDLVLLAVVLPKLSGPAAYARVCALKPEVPVLFVTGYSPDIALLEKVQQQGFPVLQKPYAPQDLARKVRETLDQHARLISRD
jgi:two-component system, cell cycle sensor histidine kinase and response regulator CckA